MLIAAIRVQCSALYYVLSNSSAFNSCSSIIGLQHSPTTSTVSRVLHSSTPFIDKNILSRFSLHSSFKSDSNAAGTIFANSEEGKYEKHPLKRTWVLWFDNPSLDRLEQKKHADWMDSLHNVSQSNQSHIASHHRTLNQVTAVCTQAGTYAVTQNTHRPSACAVPTCRPRKHTRIYRHTAPSNRPVDATSGLPFHCQRPFALVQYACIGISPDALRSIV